MVIWNFNLQLGGIAFATTAFFPNIVLIAILLLLLRRLQVEWMGKFIGMA